MGGGVASSNLNYPPVRSGGVDLGSMPSMSVFVMRAWTVQEEAAAASWQSVTCWRTSAGAGAQVKRRKGLPHKRLRGSGRVH